MLARSAIDFRREIFYPGTVEVGSRFLKLGNRSVTSGYGVFVGDTCVATAECVNVFFDMKARQSVVPSGALRGLLETVAVAAIVLGRLPRSRRTAFALPGAAGAASRSHSHLAAFGR